MTRAPLARFAWIADAIEQRAYSWLIEPARHRRYERLRAAEDRVLWAMRGGGQNFGYPLSRAADVRPSLMYGALDRLQQKGLVTNGWEDEPVRPRRWYQLTEDGRRLVAIRQSIAEETGERS